MLKDTRGRHSKARQSFSKVMKRKFDAFVDVLSLNSFNDLENVCICVHIQFAACKSSGKKKSQQGTPLNDRISC
jgi:hypothetical protein